MNSQPNQKQPPGQLFVVATPIGNLGDITYRAVEVLRDADLIAAEDTRASRRLFDRYAIKTPVISCHEYNERSVAGTLLKKLEAGKDIALVSDAGTPLISDPGFRLVRELRGHGIRITPVPGACSPIAALSVCGLPTDHFIFSGFLPRSGKARRQRLKEIANAAVTQLILESPKRLLATLHELAEYCGPDRRICVAREMTKLHETVICDALSKVTDAMAAARVRGEIVLVIGAANGTRRISDEEIMLELKRENTEDLPPPARAKKIAQLLRIPRSRVYALLMQEKKA